MKAQEAFIKAYGASKTYTDKVAVAFASGFDHAEATSNADGSVTLTIYFTNGTTVQGKIDGVQGRGIDNVTVKQEADGNHLICIMDDGEEIDAGILDVTVEGYTQEIASLSNTWHIQHNLNTEWWKLNIHLISETGAVLFGEVDTTLTTKNLIVVNFESPMQGKAYIKK